ncbi:unnamed protein product, partial [Symbiodinium microadriaticum]
VLLLHFTRLKEMAKGGSQKKPAARQVKKKPAARQVSKKRPSAATTGQAATQASSGAKRPAARQPCAWGDDNIPVHMVVCIPHGGSISGRFWAARWGGRHMAKGDDTFPVAGCAAHASHAAVDLSSKPWLQVPSHSQEDGRLQVPSQGQDNVSQEDVSLSQETLAFAFQDPLVSQKEFEEAMKNWPEEPDSFHDPSQEAEDQAPPGHLLVWDFLSPLQKRILQQNPRARDGLQACSPPVPKVAGLPESK